MRRKCENEGCLERNNEREDHRLGGGRLVGTKSEGGAFLRIGAGAAAGLTLPAGNLEGPGPRGGADSAPSSFGFFEFPGRSIASLIRFLAPVRGAEGAAEGGGGAPFNETPFEGAELADRRGSAAFDP